MLPSTDDKKCAKQFKQKNPRKPLQHKPVLTHKAREKGSKKLNQGERIFHPNPPAKWVKKRYPLLFRKYEINKGRHLYRTHKKAVILQCTCRLKKNKVPVFAQKINQSIACTNAEIERLRGEKSFFPPTKDIGTRVWDHLDTVKVSIFHKKCFFSPFLPSASNSIYWCRIK